VQRYGLFIKENIDFFIKIDGQSYDLYYIPKNSRIFASKIKELRYDEQDYFNDVCHNDGDIGCFCTEE
jgi:hypothetical protein